MNEMFKKYEISLEDLVNYVEDNLAEDKIAKVVNAIENEKEIQDLYSGFLIMKDENPENSLNAEIDDQWANLMDNESVEDESEENELLSPRSRRIPKYFYQVAAILLIGLMSIFVLQLFSNKTPKELAQVVLDGDLPTPLKVRGEPQTENWKDDFLKGEYKAILNLSVLDTTQQEDILFFAGLSSLLAEHNNPKEAIGYFDRVKRNKVKFYDDEAIFYSAIAYILLGEKKKAENLLMQCKLEKESENINQLLEALRR